MKTFNDHILHTVSCNNLLRMLLKLHYLLLFGSIASTLGYQDLYLDKFVGLNTITYNELTMMYLVILVSFRPIICALADYLNVHRVTLISCMFVAAMSSTILASLAWLPQILLENQDNLNLLFNHKSQVESVEEKPPIDGDDFVTMIIAFSDTNKNYIGLTSFIFMRLSIGIAIVLSDTYALFMFHRNKTLYGSIKVYGCIGSGLFGLMMGYIPLMGSPFRDITTGKNETNGNPSIKFSTNGYASEDISINFLVQSLLLWLDCMLLVVGMCPKKKIRLYNLKETYLKQAKQDRWAQFGWKKHRSYSGTEQYSAEEDNHMPANNTNDKACKSKNDKENDLNTIKLDVTSEEKQKDSKRSTISRPYANWYLANSYNKHSDCVDYYDNDRTKDCNYSSFRGTLKESCASTTARMPTITDSTSYYDTNSMDFIFMRATTSKTDANNNDNFGHFNLDGHSSENSSESSSSSLDVSGDNFDRLANDELRRVLKYNNIKRGLTSSQRGAREFTKVIKKIFRRYWILLFSYTLIYLCAGTISGIHTNVYYEFIRLLIPESQQNQPIQSQLSTLTSFNCLCHLKAFLLSPTSEQCDEANGTSTSSINELFNGDQYSQNELNNHHTRSSLSLQEQRASDQLEYMKILSLAWFAWSFGGQALFVLNGIKIIRMIGRQGVLIIVLMVYLNIYLSFTHLLWRYLHLMILTEALGGIASALFYFSLVEAGYRCSMNLNRLLEHHNRTLKASKSFNAFSNRDQEYIRNNFMLFITAGNNRKPSVSPYASPKLMCRQTTKNNSIDRSALKNTYSTTRGLTVPCSIDTMDLNETIARRKQFKRTFETDLSREQQNDIINSSFDYYYQQQQHIRDKDNHDSSNNEDDDRPLCTAATFQCLAISIQDAIGPLFALFISKYFVRLGELRPEDYLLRIARLQHVWCFITHSCIFILLMLGPLIVYKFVRKCLNKRKRSRRKARQNGCKNQEPSV